MDSDCSFGIVPGEPVITPIARTDVEMRAITARCQMSGGTVLNSEPPDGMTAYLAMTITAITAKKFRVAAGGWRHRAVNRPAIDPVRIEAGTNSTKHHVLLLRSRTAQPLTWKRG